MSVLALPKIVSTPDTMHGAPRIDGHRIRVSDIAVMHVHQGRTVEDIAESYFIRQAPGPRGAGVLRDHREEIEADIDADNRAVDEIRAREPSRLPRTLPGR